MTDLDLELELATVGIRFERRRSIGWCTVDRPEAHNTLTPQMYAALGRVVEVTADDSTLRALVLTGTGRIFIAGGDISSEAVDSAGDVELPFERFRHSRVPVIAAINGLCQASGLLFAMLADVAIACESATFRAPELHSGFPDTWLAAVLPTHVGMARAKDLVLTGRRIDAVEAERIGLVARVVPDEDLEDAATTAAHAVLHAGPAARRVWLEAADVHYGSVDAAAFAKAVAGAEAQEGFAAILAKRAPSWAPEDGRV